MKRSAWLLALGVLASVAGPPSVVDAALPKGKLGGPEEAMHGHPGEPGSGIAREQAGTPDPSRLKAPLPVRPRNEVEAAGIEEMEALTHRYKAALEATQETLQTTLLIEAQEGKELLQKHYDAEIREHQAKARVLRSKAIARYEDFLELHPDDATWTPEIMFRLAELHFEASSERFRRQEDAWEKQLAAIQEKKDAGEEVGEPPPSPQIDYTASVGLFSDVVTRFPRYPHNDAALYMMGVLLFEEEDFDTSRQSFLALACSNHYEVPSKDRSNVVSANSWRSGDYSECEPLRKGSRHVTEAWLRTGEVHYDMDELDPALEAYAAAIEDRESDLYSAALIRIAWTLYLKREFGPAVARFDEFVKFADEVKGTDRGLGAAEYRDDAVRYIAKCYVEEDWDRDGRRDRPVGLARLDRDYAQRKDEPHVPEIYAALGDLFAFQTEFIDAIEIWKLALKRWPTTAKAPMIQLKILQGYQALQDKEGARGARDALATNYLRGTAWFYANEHDPEAIEAGFKLAEDALVATAVDHHQRAQTHRAAGEDEKAKVEYRIAAKAYAAYLERFPNTASSYEYRYQFGESLFFSDQYLKAAETFIEVRDSNLDNRLQGDAADSVVAALESYVEEEEKAGRFSMPDMPKRDEQGNVPADLEPKDIPELAMALQDAYDRHAEIRPDSTDAGKMKFRAGAIEQRYRQFDAAEERFVVILDQHCGEEVAVNAGYAIIDAHVVKADLAGTREWTDKLGAMNCGGEGSAEFAGKLKSIGNAVRFEEAKLLAEAGEFEAAADRYVALVDQAPDDPNADLALYNAAVSYERIGRFGSASKTYERIYKSYGPCPEDVVPKPKGCSEWADDALLRTGFNHSRFFEYETAVRSYLILAEDAKFEASEFRLTALKNAASLLDNLQQYERSSELHLKTAKKADEPADKAKATFEAARVLGKTGKQKKTIAAYKRYLNQYGSMPDQAERSVEAWLNIGRAYREMKDRRSAADAYRKVVSTFSARGLPMASDAADFPSEAQFRLAEYSLGDVMKTKVTGTGRKLERSAKQLIDQMVVATKEFDDVFPYRRIEWVLAAMFQRGLAFETVSGKFRTAPVPKSLKPNSEAWFAYKDIIDKQLIEPAENKAIGLYEETLKRAAQFKISNQWTARARERLNLYKPEEFPLLRDPALELEVEDRRP